MPRTVEDLALKIRTFFQVTEHFRLQYNDKDMGDQFMNLLSILELEDKGTLKVGLNMRLHSINYINNKYINLVNMHFQ